MTHNSSLFSNITRASKLKEAENTQFDLIVIGGGITGAGILLDASLRGLKVLLIEKEDFASGTSSKSTKLIHGGLRYLKQLEFGLVRESGLERTIVHHMAYHLVHPRKMILPIVENGSFSKFSASLAISVYDRLAKVKDEQKRKTLSKEKLIQLEPTFKKELIKSGIQYFEYRTDDARLTMELIKAGIREGSEAFNYSEVTGFTYQDGKINGVKCLDKISNAELEFKGDIVVSSTGPWVDKLRIKDNAQTETNLHLSKGVHIVLAKASLPIRNSIYFDAFDGRMIFAIPRGNIVYVGTTDTTYSGNPDVQKCDAEDANYLLKAVNNFFEVPVITIASILSSWSGLRPLIQQKGKKATELSRKDEIFESDSGLISIAGGKLTGFRKMAERIVDLVYKKNTEDFVECKTKGYPLHQKPFNSYSEYQSFISSLIEKHYDLKDSELRSLVDNFGTDALTILDNHSKHQNNLILAQLAFTLDNELVFHPLDFFERRTGMLYFDIEKMRETYKEVSAEICKYLDLPKETQEQFEEDCLKAIRYNSLEDFK